MVSINCISSVQQSSSSSHPNHSYAPTCHNNLPSLPENRCHYLRQLMILNCPLLAQKFNYLCHTTTFQVLGTSCALNASELIVVHFGRDPGIVEHRSAILTQFLTILPTPAPPHVYIVSFLRRSIDTQVHVLPGVPVQQETISWHGLLRSSCYNTRTGCKKPDTTPFTSAKAPGGNA